MLSSSLSKHRKSRELRSSPEPVNRRRNAEALCWASKRWCVFRRQKVDADFRARRGGQRETLGRPQGTGTGRFGCKAFQESCYCCRPAPCRGSRHRQDRETHLDKQAHIWRKATSLRRGALVLLRIPLQRVGKRALCDSACAPSPASRPSQALVGAQEGVAFRAVVLCILEGVHAEGDEAAAEPAPAGGGGGGGQEKARQLQGLRKALARAGGSLVAIQAAPLRPTANHVGLCRAAALPISTGDPESSARSAQAGALADGAFSAQLCPAPEVGF